jgi:hypothetical protein
MTRPSKDAVAVLQAVLNVLHSHACDCVGHCRCESTLKDAAAKVQYMMDGTACVWQRCAVGLSASCGKINVPYKIPVTGVCPYCNRKIIEGA